MRRIIAAAMAVAAALPLSGCASGPSDAEIAAVTASVGAHEDTFTVRYVDTERSTTSGLSRSLTVGVEFVDSPVGADALATALAAIAAPLPEGYRTGLILSAKDGDGFADLTAAASALGFPESGGYASGEIQTTVDEIDTLVGGA